MSEIAQTCWWLKEALAHPEFRGDPSPVLDRDIAQQQQGGTPVIAVKGVEQG